MVSIYDIYESKLKAVLLHNGNILPSIPVGHAVQMKETYDNKKELFRCVNYDQHQWQLCGELKVVALFLDLQIGYTKHYFFFHANGIVVQEIPTTSRKIGHSNSH